MKYELCFQSAPETLHGGVVVTVPLGTHGRAHIKLFQQVLILMRTVLTAAVRMMNQPGRWSFSLNCPEQRLADQILRHSGPHGITDDLSSAHILMSGQIKPPLFCRNIRQVAQPHLSWSAGFKSLRQKIVSHWQRMTRVCCGLETSFLAAAQAKLSAQTLDTVYPDHHPMICQFPLQPFRTIAFPRTAMGSKDLKLQSSILSCPARRRPAEPGIISTPGYLENSTK